MTLQKKQAREKAYKRQRGVCYYCKTPVAKKNATLEHRVPASAGGNLQAGNAVMTCRRCNEDKGSMPEDVFLQGEEARRAWKRRQASLWRATNADPELALAYANFTGHAAQKARAMLAVAEAKTRRAKNPPGAS